MSWHLAVNCLTICHCTLCEHGYLVVLMNVFLVNNVAEQLFLFALTYHFWENVKVLTHSVISFFVDF